MGTTPKMRHQLIIQSNFHENGMNENKDNWTGGGGSKICLCRSATAKIFLRNTRVNLFFPICEAFMTLPHRTVGTKTLADHSCTADILLWIVGSSAVKRSDRSAVRSRWGDTDIAPSLCRSSQLVCPNHTRYIHSL